MPDGTARQVTFMVEAEVVQSPPVIEAARVCDRGVRDRRPRWLCDGCQRSGFLMANKLETAALQDQFCRQKLLALPAPCPGTGTAVNLAAETRRPTERHID